MAKDKNNDTPAPEQQVITKQMTNEEILQSEVVQTAIADAIASESAKTDGLKTNSTKILSEKKELEDKLKDYDKYDFEKIDVLLQSIEQSDNAKLIEEGRFDEIVEKNVNKVKEESTFLLGEKDKEINQYQDKINLLESQINNTVIADSIRDEATKAGVKPEAMSDVISKANGIFKLGNDNKVVASDALGDTDSVEGFVKGLKESSPHYWPEKQNFDLAGSSGSRASVQDQMTSAAESGDFDAYKKARDKQEGKAA